MRGAENFLLPISKFGQILDVFYSLIVKNAKKIPLQEGLKQK